MNAEIMVALMWSEEETPEAERVIAALMDRLLDEDWDTQDRTIEDDHADRVADATVVEAGHTVTAAVDHDHDVDFFAFVAEEGNHLPR